MNKLELTGNDNFNKGDKKMIRAFIFSLTLLAIAYGQGQTPTAADSVSYPDLKLVYGRMNVESVSAAQYAEDDVMVRLQVHGHGLCEKNIAVHKVIRTLNFMYINAPGVSYSNKLCFVGIEYLWNPLDDALWNFEIPTTVASLRVGKFRVSVRLTRDEDFTYSISDPWVTGITE